MDYEPKINSTGGEVPQSSEAQNEDIENQIQIQDVQFNYPTKKEVQVLKKITLDVSKNKVIAFVGPSGKY